MIATLTLNPALDKSTKVGLIRPESKLRCDVNSQPNVAFNLHSCSRVFHALMDIFSKCQFIFLFEMS